MGVEVELKSRPTHRNPSSPTDLKAEVATTTTTALPSLLSVKQLAQLLQINEKKVYQLAAEGDIPCTKVTGKWLFPRHLVHDWVEQNSHGGSVSDRLILTGADDLLLDRICRRMSLELGRSAVMCYLPSGSMHGLRLLAARRADGCFFHWGASEKSGRRHLGLLRSFREHSQWVTVHCFDRSEGLAFSPESVSKLKGPLQILVNRQHREITERDNEALLKLLSTKKLIWAQRHHESGTQRLLEDICFQHAIHPDQLGSNVKYYAGERETAAAVAHNQADVALTSEAVAREYALQFVTIDKVAVDLVLARKTYFNPVVQAFLKQMLQTNDSIQKQWDKAYQLPENHEITVVKTD